jgi:rhomboid protease GluP
MIRWAVFALIFGMFMGADNAAHLTGLGAGVGLAFLVSGAERTRLRPAAVRAWDLSAILCACLVAASFGMALS